LRKRMAVPMHGLYNPSLLSKTSATVRLTMNERLRDLQSFTIVIS
jgi:hypothetical protein